MITTENDYKRFMYQYGILSVLYVLNYFEFEENYEECQKIINAIKEQEKYLNTNLFTTITKETVQQVIDNYKVFNLTGCNAVRNSKHYSTLILKIIHSPICSALK